MRLTPEEIRDYLDQRDAVRGRKPDCVVRQYGAAVYVLGTILGGEWVDRHLLPSNRRRATFLAPEITDDCDGYKHQDRVVALAEILLNLQDVDGFDGRLPKWRTESAETVLGEAEGLRLLYRAGILTRLPLEGTDGRFDAEVICGGTILACEVKTKLASTELSEATIEKSLATARRQLPAGLPGIVILKIPESWTRVAATPHPLELAVVGALSASSRIVAVLVHWEQWVAMEDGAARVTQSALFENHASSLRIAALAAALGPSRDELSGGGWIEFEALCCAESDRARSWALRLGLWLSEVGGVKSLRQVPLPSGGQLLVGKLFRGSLSSVRARAATAHTIVDFHCEELEAFDDVPRDAPCIAVDRGGRTFTVCRGKGKGDFQLVFEHFVDDPGLVADPVTGAARPSDQAMAAMLSGDDVVMTLLGPVFRDLRLEGVLVRPQHLLHSIVLWYRDTTSGAPMFVVEYHEVKAHV